MDLTYGMCIAKKTKGRTEKQRVAQSPSLSLVQQPSASKSDKANNPTGRNEAIVKPPSVLTITPGGSIANIVIAAFK